MIWDMDGTLIDSGNAHWTSWRAIFSEAGYPDLDHATFLTWFGRRNDDIIREHFGPDIPLEEAMRLAHLKEEHYREGLLATPTPIPPGVNDWLDRLEGEGWALGIGTSAPAHNIGVILDQAGWTGRFGAIVTREDVSRGKPDPEVFLTAASQLGVDPGRAIVVEDAAAGVLGAHRAGMRTIGVGIGYATLGAMLATPTLDLLPDDAFDRLLELPVPAER